MKPGLHHHMCLDARNPRTLLPANSKSGNNKGADKAAQPRSLISRYQKSKVARPDISYFSILMSFNIMINTLATPLQAL